MSGRRYRFRTANTGTSLGGSCFHSAHDPHVSLLWEILYAPLYPDVVITYADGFREAFILAGARERPCLNHMSDLLGQSKT